MPRIISIHYTLTSPSGEKLDTSIGREAFPYLEGSHAILPALEQKIAALKTGDKSRVELGAADAYGTRDEDLLMTVPPENLPAKDVKVGDKFRSGKEEDSPVFTVIKVAEAGITLDGNHPLAGQDLVFDLEVISMREAMPDEVAHGHAHAPGHSH